MDIREGIAGRAVTGMEAGVGMWWMDVGRVGRGTREGNDSSPGRNGAGRMWGPGRGGGIKGSSLQTSPVLWGIIL